MKFIKHPLIRPESLEEREYQLAIAMRALDGNAMVVLPTGLGKTVVALLVVASRIKNEGGKILILAPTKPLVDQHHRFFKQYLMLPNNGAAKPELFAMFTGETSILERSLVWKEAKVIFATPQVIKNDVIAGRYSLEDVSLLVIDECHRAVGNYAYVFLAQAYQTTAKKPLILAMTASPGSARQRVEGVCANLGIEIVETRVESDADVQRYVHDRDLEFITVDLPESLGKALKLLNELVTTRLKTLVKMNFFVPKKQYLTIKVLNAINMQIQERLHQRDRAAYGAASLYAEIMKLRHAIALVESQGSEPLKRYLEKLAADATSSGSSRASKHLVRDPLFSQLLASSRDWKEEHHPKLGITLSIIKAQLSAYPTSRSIIFATYRDTVQLITDSLRMQGVAAERFIGQATKDTDKGFSQKKQIEILNRFRSGEIKVLIATSVGEEGLDIPSTDLVIFYEAVPSEIRSIQRKGRTGRRRPGKIIVLVTRGTTDEAYRYVSQTRERAMLSEIRSMSDRQSSPKSSTTIQTDISAFIVKGPIINVDEQEITSRIVETLSELGATIKTRKLEQGNFTVGDRILVKRITTDDLTKSLVEGKLFEQLNRLVGSERRPVIIVEGIDLYSLGDLHPSAIRRTLIAITVDLGIPILFTKDEGDTAQMIYTLAKREYDGSHKEDQM